jgi:hypothetical protein
VYFQIKFRMCTEPILPHTKKLESASPEGEGFQPSPKGTLNIL